MPKIPIESYVFNASAGTLIFSDYAEGGIVLTRIISVINVSRGVFLFNILDPNKLGTVTGNVLTLDLDTSSMDDDDQLVVTYNDPDAVDGVFDDVWDRDVRALRYMWAEAMTEEADSIQTRPKGIPPISWDGTTTYQGSTPVVMQGFYVCSTSSGVIQLYNHASGDTTPVGGNITPAAGWHPLPGANFTVALRAKKISGDINIIFVPYPYTIS